LLAFIQGLRLRFALANDGEQNGSRHSLTRRCALTAPFHPYPDESGRYVFCGTFRRSALEGGPPGCYPAHRSMEFGLSSPGRALRRRRQPSTRQERPSGPLATLIICDGGGSGASRSTGSKAWNPSA